jgi:hypothetical protein
MLPCVVVCCSVIPCDAVCCSVVQFVAVCRILLQHGAMCRWQPALLIRMCISTARCAFQLLDCKRSHLGILVLYCTPDTLLIASCLFWFDVIAATAIPMSLFRLNGFFLSLNYFLNINFLSSCLSIKSTTARG